MTDPRSTFTPTYYEQALRDWVVLVATAIDANVIVNYANQRGYKPQRPFITLQVLSQRDAGIYKKTTDTADGGDWVGEVISRVSGTVSITIYAVNHRAIAEALKASTMRPDVIEALANDKVYITRFLSLQDVSEALSTAFEPRSVIDFAFNSAYKYEHTAQAIDEVKVTVTGQALTGDITQTETI